MSKCGFDKTRNCTDDCEWYQDREFGLMLDGERMGSPTHCGFLETQFAQTLDAHNMILLMVETTDRTNKEMKL